MIGDIEEIKKKLIHGLSNKKCEIDDVTIDHTFGQIPTMSCKVTIPDDLEMRGGWHRPPEKIWIGTGRANGKSYYDVDTDSMKYHYNDWLCTAKAYKEIRKNQIKNVIFNNPATIVFWGDGTKTVVKCDNEDEFDPEKGLAMAIAKHFLGTNKSKGNYYNAFEKWLPKEEKTIEEEVTLYFDNEPVVTKRKIRAKIVKDDE